MFNNGKYHLLKVKGLSHKQYNFYVVPEPKMLDNFWANSEFTCLDGYENSYNEKTSKSQPNSSREGSLAHSANCPTASGLLIARRNGLSVRNIIVWAWKYGLSLRAAVTKAKASFSIGKYLSSTPRSARLA